MKTVADVTNVTTADVINKGACAPLNTKEEKLRILNAKCKKCGATVRIKMGDKSREEVIEKLSAWDGFECPGFHVEIVSPVNFWEFGEITEEEDGKTNEQLRQELIEKHGIENVLTTQDFNHYAGIEHIGYGFFRNADYSFDRINLNNGERAYIRRERCA